MDKLYIAHGWTMDRLSFSIRNVKDVLDDGDFYVFILADGSRKYRRKSYIWSMELDLQKDERYLEGE